MQKQIKITKLFFFLATFFMLPHFARATNPTSEPLLQQSDLQYVGAFRVPQGKLGTVSTSQGSLSNQGGRALSFNPINNSLFMMGNVYEVLLSELKIPSTISNSQNINDLTTATVLQNPLDITNGKGCFTGPIDTNPLDFNYNQPSSECAADDFTDYTATITLSAKTGNGVTVTTTTQWNTSTIKPGFFILEPGGGIAIITSVTSSVLTVNITTNFINTTLVNNSSNSQTSPSWYLRDSAGIYMPDGNVLLGGTLVDSANNKLIGSTYNVYDASSNTTFSHFTANLNWSSSLDTQGMYRLGSTLPDHNFSTPGFVSGYMGWIPSEWQASFGKNALTGMGPVAIISRASYGPGLFAFNTSDVEGGTLGGVNNPVPITPLVYYPSDHQTLGIYDNSEPNPLVNQATQVYGVVFPSGTSSVLLFGRTGMGPQCYGIGVLNQSQAANDTTIAQWIINNNSTVLYNACNIPGNSSTVAAINTCIADGEETASECTIDSIADCIVNNGGTGYTCGDATLTASSSTMCCYDPGSSDHGNHVFPYDYYIWAYNANDLLAASSGAYRVTANDFSSCRFQTDASTTPPTCLAEGQIVQPWNVVPYTQWDLGTAINGYGIAGDDGISGHGDNKILGAAYDPATQRIFISQNGADGGYPLIQVYHVNANAVSDTTPPAAPSGLSVM